MSTATPNPAARSSPPRSRKPARAIHAGSGARRTTVTLSPASQAILERFQTATGVSASAAIDQLILRSEPQPSRLVEANGFLVLSSRKATAGSARPVTLEDIKRVEEEMDREYVERRLHPKPALPKRAARKGRRP